MKLIAPSILSADFSKLGEEVRAVDVAGAHWIHVDVMDGHFVPNLTIGPVVVASLRKCTKLPLDVHLMITEPQKYTKEFISAGANNITFHIEANCDHVKLIEEIKLVGIKAGISLSPQTEVRMLKKVLPLVDLVLVMTVNPGFGGQELIGTCLSKIEELQKIRSQNKYSFLIEVDGGINLSNIAKVSKTGADVFVAGSAIFKTADYKKTIQDMTALV